MSDKLFFPLYVDYFLWFSKKNEEIDDVISYFRVNGDKYN